MSEVGYISNWMFCVTSRIEDTSLDYENTSQSVPAAGSGILNSAAICGYDGRINDMRLQGMEVRGVKVRQWYFGPRGL